jgi:DNA repair protein RadA
LLPGEITQFYGAATAGKTHLCHFFCVILPSQHQVIYIDTEGTFRVEKIQSIAKARKLDPVNILQNIHVEQPKNSEQQELCIEKACSAVNKSNSNFER